MTIADGTRASPGDLILCTRNDHSVEAGEPGRTLANGDLLRIDAITRRGLLVRRALDADPVTGQRRWTDRHFVFNSYKDAELGYAVTDHAAQGRTVTAGLAVITGTEDRQHAYVALTRGTEVNVAYVFTASPTTADPAPGPRPAPELARYDRRTARPDAHAPLPPRRGRRWPCWPGCWTATASCSRPPRPATRPWPTRTTWPSCTRSGPPRPPRPATSATATCSWAPCRPATAGNPATRRNGCGGPCAPPNWPAWTPPRSWPSAIAERDLAGSRDIAAVLDARIRHRLGSLVPLPPGPWSAQVPALADPDRQAYVAEIAALMDARTDRIGEHAAGHPPAWAITALGPVPAHPAGRLGWQKRAAAIGAWRELSGYDDPADPIGPEPAAAAPDARAAWHQALAALGPADGPDVRGMPDGRLLHLRDTYPVETAWAPPYVGDELRQVRAAAWDARLAGLRACAEARAATQRGDHDHAAAQRKLAAGYQALEQAYRQRETVFATVMADRADWDQATRAQRQLAVAADAELRRRHPGQYFSPLRSAEPEPATGAQRDELTLTPDTLPGEMDQQLTDLAAGHRTFAGKLADRQSQTIPSQDPDYGDLGPAFPAWTGPGREPILQPPRPEIPPSPQILQKVMDRDADWEAAD